MVFLNLIFGIIRKETVEIYPQFLSMKKYFQSSIEIIENPQKINLCLFDKKKLKLNIFQVLPKLLTTEGNKKYTF